MAGTISGFVYDSETREVIIGATVIDLISGQGGISNSFGFYSISLPDVSNSKLRFSYVGYKFQLVEGPFTQGQKLNVYLEPGINLEAVTVYSQSGSRIVKESQMSMTRIRVQEIEKLPNFFGEVDIIKALQLTPGVQSGGEGKSQIYVRGGSPDQNLILLDDVPLYYVAHFGGFLSVFNADAIKDVQLLRGGFPARYGSRLSSVMEIRMKDGNMNRYTAEGSLGLVSSRVLLEGPLIKGKSSAMISGRRNIFPIFRMTGNKVLYNFYDVNAKISYSPGENDRLYLSFYKGNDLVFHKTSLAESFSRQATTWGNTLLSLRWNRVFNNSFFSNITFARTKYSYETSLEISIGEGEDLKDLSSTVFTGIDDFIFKSDFTWLVSPKYKVYFGSSNVLHLFKPNDQEFSLNYGDVSVDQNYESGINAWEHSLYLENHFENRFFNINAGVRASSFFVSQKDYYNIDPRFSVNVPLSECLSFKYSYAAMNQYVHLLTYSGAGMPADYWLPSTNKVPPSRSFQHSTGFARFFGKGNYEVSIEAYYKKLKNLMHFKPGEFFNGHLDSWELLAVGDGKGINYGAEFFVQKVSGRTTGWIGLTLSRAIREFPQLNQQQEFPFAYDRPVDLSIVWNYQLTPGVLLSATWTYGSGYPLTLASERYFVEGRDVFVYDKINSYRMRDYHRLDLAVNFPSKTRYGERTWTISIFNLYNRMNPWYYFYDRKMSGFEIDESGTGFIGVNDDLKLYQRTLFGFFPSFSFNFKIF